MRVVVLGAAGQTGRVLAHLARRRGWLVGAFTHQELDITDAQAVDRALTELQPTHVLNAAAYNAVDAAEDDPDTAQAINAHGPGHVARVARRVGAAVVHFSTDYVFAGERATPYREEDEPNPQTVYALSKLAGEQAVLTEQPNSLVLRTSWVFGPGGRCFASRLLDDAQAQDELRFVDDVWCSPTYAPDLARVVYELIESSAPFGLYHAVGARVLSPYTWARAILDAAGSPAVLRPVSRSEFPTRAIRPVRPILATGKLAGAGSHLPGGPERLEAYFAGDIDVKPSA